MKPEIIFPLITIIIGAVGVLYAFLRVYIAIRNKYKKILANDENV